MSHKTLINDIPQCRISKYISDDQALLFSVSVFLLRKRIILQVKAVAEELGLGFAGIGFQPKWRVADVPIMPKVVLSV